MLNAYIPLICKTRFADKMSPNLFSAEHSYVAASDV